MSSSLWWQLASPGAAPPNERFPMTVAPIWRLMSDQLPVLSGAISAFVQSNWSASGGPPYLTLVEYINPVFPTPFASGVFRKFSTTASWIDAPIDPIAGYSTLSLQCIDPNFSFFAATESFGISNFGANYGIRPTTFSLQASQSDLPAGPFYVPPIFTASVGIALSDVFMNFGFTSGTFTRVGVVINASSGSPQLAMEPVDVDPDVLYPGDMWFRSGSTSDSNLAVADSNAFGVTYPAKVITSRVGETSSSVVARYGTGDAPTTTILAVNSLVVDDWLMTINTSASVGAGWQNVTWGGGIYMPNSTTVAVWSAQGQAHNFLIPSGSLIIRKDLTIQSGSFFIQSGSLNILSGSLNMLSGNIVLQDPCGSIFLSGAFSQVVVSGSNASMLLRGSPIVSVRTGSLPLAAITASNGTLYINTASFGIWLRANNQWFDFNIVAPLIIDGGFF